MGKYFGTDGFRGEANVNLTVEHAFKVGRFLGYYYGKEHQANIVIGKDTRRSSYMFEYALAAGVTASGANAYLLHVTTTPSVSYVVRTEDFDCGIMISASHNPYYDNGIKIINAQGHKIEAEVEEQIEAYIDGEIGELPLATRENIGRTVDYAMGRNRYIGHLISLATRSFKNKKVGLDCANGSASAIAKSVFDALGAKTFVIHAEPDGTNINKDCGSTHIKALQKYVIMYVCGRYMKECGKLANNTVVATIMSNIGLFKALDDAGISYEKTAVGDKYVYENMMANGHSLGGEQSGHIIFSQYARTGDGILTSIQLMEVMLEKKMSLSELTKPIHIYPQLLINVRVADKPAAKNDPQVLEAVEKFNEELAGNGRLLVRESGTEPVIRVMAEAESDELCRHYVNSVIDILKANGHVVA